jgi:hypothetical protein
MVRTLLSGGKTQTRRIVKPQPIDRQCGASRCQYGWPGDRLWVKEAWRAGANLDDSTPAEMGRMALEAGYPEPHGNVIEFYQTGHGHGC